MHASASNNRLEERLQRPPNVAGGRYPPSNIPGGSQGLPPGGYRGYQGDGPQSIPPLPPQRGGPFTPRNIIIALLVLLFLCCCCSSLGILVVRQLQQRTTGALGTLGTLTPDESDAAAVAVDFMTRLQAGDWPGAYALCTPTLQ